MTVAVRVEDGHLVIEDRAGAITGRHRSMLAFWGFGAPDSDGILVASPVDADATLDKVLSYFHKHSIPLAVSEGVAAGITRRAEQRDMLLKALAEGARFKDGDLNATQSADFLAFVARTLPRTLKEHQLKAAMHLLAVSHGANFSVPGSGKTTVVLAVYSWLRHLGEVDALYVVGPPSCFGPWRTEYESALGMTPTVALLAGGAIEERQAAYRATHPDLADLYLTSFQTLQRDYVDVRRFLDESGGRFFLVVDEAHYIKQVGGVWASAALALAPWAARRCILTGTPFPRSYSDAFNLFDFLWPRSAPLSPSDRIRIESLAASHREEDATELLSATVGPLFYRVRKSDLALAEQRFHPPIIADMGEHEARLYAAIVDGVRTLAAKDYLRDVDLLVRLRRGRMMRLRQAASYARLLSTAVLDYDEDLTQGDLSLADVIRQYDRLETPGKITALLDLVRNLREQGHRKVVVWSNFVGSLRSIQSHLDAAGLGVGLVYGDTPTETTSEDDAMTRERIIAAFNTMDSGLDILVANPAACAESVSLHKACAHAVYYDLSYNSAQYLQSLDRIHRVGGSEEKVAHYYFLQYAGTIDQDLLNNVQAKARRMAAIIDRDFPVYSLDMFGVDEELEAYGRLFQ